MNRECKKIASLLDPFLDGALEEKGREMVRAHLETCGSCKKFLKDTKEIEDAIRARSLPEPSSQEWNRMWLRIKARGESEGEESWSGGFFSFFGRLTPALRYGAYAIILIAFLGTTIFLMTRGGTIEEKKQCIVDSVESTSPDYMPTVITVDEEDLTIIWVSETGWES